MQSSTDSVQFEEIFTMNRATSERQAAAEKFLGMPLWSPGAGVVSQARAGAQALKAPERHHF
ncbi:MAG TPA: hypothetical protein VIT23_18165 [Terrimicrobiaceae bacterium]